MGFAEAEQTRGAGKHCLRHIVDIQLRLSGQLKTGWLLFLCKIVRTCSSAQDEKKRKKKVTAQGEIVTVSWRRRRSAAST